MKKLEVKHELFYREQTLANLRFLFGREVDILTCDVGSGYMIAFAYETTCDGEHVKLMQAFASDVLKALRVLHDISCKRLQELFRDCSHEVSRKDLTKCYIVLPSQIQSSSGYKESAISEDDAVSTSMHVLREDLENLKAKHGSAVLEDEWASTSTEPPVVSRNDLTPSTSVAPHAGATGYSVVIDIQYPLKRPIGALRYIDSPSRQNILQVVEQVLATNEPLDPTRFVKSLSVRKRNATYDILGYAQDRIGDLLDDMLDDILESEKLPRIECVYNI